MHDLGPVDLEYVSPRLGREPELLWLPQRLRRAKVQPPRVDPGLIHRIIGIRGGLPWPVCDCTHCIDGERKKLAPGALPGDTVRRAVEMAGSRVGALERVERRSGLGPELAIGVQCLARVPEIRVEPLLEGPHVFAVHPLDQIA